MKPSWLKSRPIQGPSLRTRKILRENNLNTVCIQARCPNKDECWGCRTATFMILGSKCTRSCRFCSVESGVEGQGVDASEATRIVDAAKGLGLSYVVLTSPDRDDLPDFGAGHYVSCIKKLVESEIKVEALTPDFAGNKRQVKEVAQSGLSCFAHNIETVCRLTPQIRDQRASYQRSLDVLSYAKRQNPDLLTKSSIMLGLGEQWDEVIESMGDLLDCCVDVLVLGQYLRPTKKQLQVEKYYEPTEFRKLREEALSLGFKYVVSEPMARTSYQAKKIFESIAL